MVIIGCFVAVAIVCSLLAAPWNGTKPLTTSNASFILVLAGLSQIPTLAAGKPIFAPIVGIILIIFWIGRNTHLPGIWLLLVGVLANGLAMATHGGAMPLAPTAATQLGIEAATQTLLPYSKDVLGESAMVGWLADWLMIRTPGATFVVSPGDLCIFAALIHWAYACRMAAPTHSQPYQDDLDVRVLGAA